MNMLIGDTTGDKSVSASDIGQTKGQSGAAVTGANFRTDINCQRNRERFRHCPGQGERRAYAAVIAV